MSLEKLSNGFLEESGWNRSLKEGSCVDKEGDFLPWYNYAVIDFLKERLNKNISVFEFGCGFSTLFYAKRCKNVVSVDVNVEWVEKVLSLGIEFENIFIEHKKTHEFAESINQEFDLIVVDSARRYDCAVNALKFLSKNGVIILDNSEREKYKNIFELMLKNEFKYLTFTGIGPLRVEVSGCSIFYKNNNIFGI